MKKTNIKSVLAIILSIVMLLTVLSSTVVANDFTKEENTYGNLCYEITVKVSQLAKLFYQTVKANDLEGLIVIAVEINNTFEPHYSVSSPSKRFDPMYNYMKSAADAATSVPYDLSLAYNQGDSSGLTKADKHMAEMIENLAKVMDEIEKHSKGGVYNNITRTGRCKSNS